MRNIHECQMLVTRADILSNVEFYLLGHKDHYHWLCCEHLNPIIEGCHGVKKNHNHWIIWNECIQQFTDSGLMSFLKRAANKWRKEEPEKEAHNNRFFNHQRVKNLQSLLIYFQTSPRKIIWERSKVPEEVREFIEAIPEKAHQRLGKHYYRQSQLQLGKHYYRQKTLA